MTPTDSVRVPRAAIAELLGGTRDEIDEMAKRTGYSRFPSPEQLRGWRCVIDSAIHHLADPAPAGTFNPEQGAGLPSEVYATVREALACECNDHAYQVCDKCQALTAIIDLEERALARQQSRAVDWANMQILIDALASEHGGDHHEDFCEICRAIAALEGGRDGR